VECVVDQQNVECVACGVCSGSAECRVCSVWSVECVVCGV